MWNHLGQIFESNLRINSYPKTLDGRDDLRAFEQHLNEQHLNNGAPVLIGSWRTLVRDQAQDFSGLRLVHMGDGTRLLFDEDKMTEQFRHGEKVYVEIDISVTAWPRRIPGQAHMLLNEQPDKI